MAIRITASGEGAARVLKVDGQLSGESALELVRACETAPGRLVLDLTDLRFADRRGVSMLRELRARGAVLQGLSPYLALLLGEGTVPHGQ
jgi:anti-anti-sigma regulatory factor